MIRNAPPKHPDSVKWYWLEWPAEELQKATIVDSSWTSEAGLQIDAQSRDGYRVGVRVSGGDELSDYVLTNQITTNNSEVLHEQLIVRVRQSGH